MATIRKYRPTDYSFAILLGLQSKPIYEGTVHPATKAKRRAADKRARAARRVTRRAGR